MEMSGTAERKKTSKTRRVAKTAADVAIGGPALAVDKALEAVDQIVDRAGGALGRGRREARKAGADATRTARKAMEGNGGRAYEERTRDELYALAVEREIDGRSSMRKAELIAALRAER
jgi:hypothetical protein